MIWTLIFWKKMLLALYHGYHLPGEYIHTIQPYIVQFVSHSSWFWGGAAFSLITLKIVLYKLGRGFLKGIKNLPISISLQKGAFAFFECVMMMFWVGLIGYAILIVILGFSWYKQPSYISWVLQNFIISWGIGTTLGIIVGIILKRLIWKYYEPSSSKWIDDKKKNRDSTLSDIRQVHEDMAKPIEFDPTEYFKSGQMFFGLDEQGKPIYESWQNFCKAHVQVMGCTGSGKGVISVCLLAQALLNESAAVVFEPKQGGDEWAPHVLKQMCMQHEKKFHLIDLQALTPQVNLLKSITPEQLDQLLQAGMGIEDKGGDGDYYRLKDRKAARQGSYLADRAENFPHFQYLMQKEMSDYLEVADSFSDKLEMICNIPAIQTSNGVDLEKALEEGDCIYIIGSSDRAQIKLLQRMVLLRIKQLIEHRDRLTVHRHVTVFIDEVKYFLTRPVLDSLAMIRDHQCNLFLAHQAPGDLYDVPKDIDGQACYACVTNNTNIKLIYKINEAKDQKMAASLTGSKVIQRDSKEVMTNSGMGELIETDRKHTMDVQAPLYDENFFSAMKERIGVLLGCGVARLCFTSPIRVEKSQLNIEAAERCAVYQSKDEDVSDLGGLPKAELKAEKKPKSVYSGQENNKKLQKDEDDIQYFDELIYENEGEGGHE